MAFPHQRSNDIVSGSLHAFGLMLAITALVLMAIFSQGPKAVTSTVIFGSGLTLLYLTSALYHLFPPKLLKAKSVLRKLDHSMIYFLIAASYTPICLLILPAGWGWSLFGVSWGLASIGIISKLVPRLTLPINVSVAHYLVMGWLILIAWPVLDSAFSGVQLFWLGLGGVIYTVGVLFFILDQKIKIKGFGLHEVFHLFIMAGSFCHFWLMLWYI